MKINIYLVFTYTLHFLVLIGDEMRLKRPKVCHDQVYIVLNALYEKMQTWVN